MQKFSYDMIDTQIESNIKLFKELIKTPVMTYDLATLDNMTEEFSNLPNIDYVILRDHKHKVLSEFHKKDHNEKYGEEYHPIEKFTITNGSHILGYGEVTFDIGDIIKANELQTRDIIKIALIEIFFSTFVAFYLGRVLSKNLTILDEALKNTSSEQTKVNPVSIKSGDEFEHLATSFNDMQTKILDEVTKNKERQLQLTQQSKMAALGEMLGNISHQWRQPLSSISVAASGMKMQKEFDMLSDKEMFDSCDEIKLSCQYLSQTIDDFTDFVKGDNEKSLFDLKENIENFLVLVKGLIKNNKIEVVLDLEEDINLFSYPNELVQCLMNIFNNAKDALKDTHEQKYVFISCYTKENDAYISIKDNAGGIPEDILPKIFEPYFTTKHKSQGTGLGLHMTYNLIIEGMDGLIDVKNVHYKYAKKHHHGAEFLISFKCVSQTTQV